MDNIVCMGLDFGERRIGVAVSDALGITAQPLTVVERQSNKKDIERIKQICREYGVRVIVVGHPLNMDGSEGPAARKAAEFAGKLQTALQTALQNNEDLGTASDTDIRVHLTDERLTSSSAEKVLLEADMRRSHRKKNRDKLAASLILQNYLSRVKNMQGEAD